MKNHNGNQQTTPRTNAQIPTKGQFLDKKQLATFLDIVKMSKVTFELLSRNYLQYAKVNKLSWGCDERSIRLLSKKFAGMKLSLITPLAIEECKNERRQVVAPATVNRELACLKHVLTKAIHWDMASINPVKLVKLFREDNARTRYLSLDEIDKLLSSISERVRPMVITALNTGMRLGEILKLKWEDVDLTNRVIIVRRSKNGYSRDIPVTDQLYQALKPIDQSKEYVFSNADGNPVRSIRTVFEKAVQSAGLKDFTFHDLRDTFASHLVMNFADLLTVKKLLGHRTINLTVHYSHLSQSHKWGAVDTLRFPDKHHLDTKVKGSKKAKIVSASPTMTEHVCRSGEVGRRKGLTMQWKETVEPIARELGKSKSWVRYAARDRKRTFTWTVGSLYFSKEELSAFIAEPLRNPSLKKWNKKERAANKKRDRS